MAKKLPREADEAADQSRRYRDTVEPIEMLGWIVGGVAALVAIIGAFIWFAFRRRSSDAGDRVEALLLAAVGVALPLTAAWSGAVVVAAGAGVVNSIVAQRTYARGRPGDTTPGSRVG